jgi:hypothetical protein
VETIEESEEMVDVFETEQVAGVDEEAIDVEEDSFAEDTVVDATAETARDSESQTEELDGVVEEWVDVEEAADGVEIDTTVDVEEDVPEDVPEDVAEEVPHE